MRFKRGTGARRARIEIIPMIDTMFFLLVFFMLSSLALTRLSGMPVHLPKAGTSVRQTQPDLTLTVDKQGKIFVNQAETGLDGIAAALMAKPQAELKNATLVINADESTTHGLVVRCIDRARAAGITKFTIATETGEAQGGPAN